MDRDEIPVGYEIVCFVPHPEPDGFNRIVGELQTCIAPEGCTIDWHEHLLRPVSVEMNRG